MRCAAQVAIELSASCRSASRGVDTHSFQERRSRDWSQRADRSCDALPAASMAALYSVQQKPYPAPVQQGK